MPIAETIYLLCAATSLVAALMLVRHYRREATPLLLWSSIGFLGLAANNVLVFVDLVIVPATDLSLVRSAVGLAAVASIIFGLVWEARS
jgi:hypothetical protein